MVNTMKKKTFPKKCGNCNYLWDARIEHPKECPRCKYRFDYNAGRKQADILKKRRM